MGTCTNHRSMGERENGRDSMNMNFKALTLKDELTVDVSDLLDIIVYCTMEHRKDIDSGKDRTPLQILKTYIPFEEK